MTVPVSWEITYDCGHRHLRDLGGLLAGERAGAARWWQYRACPACSPLTRQPSRAIQEQVAAETADRYELPVMVGAVKHRRWGSHARNELVTTAHTHLVNNGSVTEAGFLTGVIVPARRILSGQWWVHNRTANPEDLPELVNNLDLRSYYTRP